MNILSDLAGILRGHVRVGIDRDMRIWRRRISDAVFYFFTIFGLFTYVPSLVLSIREGVYGIAILSTVLYLFCIAFTIFRRIDYHLKAVAGSILFYVVGVALMVVLGPKGAGEIWLFGSTLLIALLLGNRGALISFIGNTLFFVLFLVLLRVDVFAWQATSGVTLDDWLIKSVNFVLLNLAILVAHAVFTRGFENLIARSVETRNASIIGLAKLAEYRDNETGVHLGRFQEYTALLARELSRKEAYRGYIDSDYVDDLKTSSILHDIGKVGVPDRVLLKPGSLTSEEFEMIKQHPEMGAEVISEIERHVHGQSLYTLSREIALCHHEKWDGSGYPAGLAGVKIPLSARITALADVYDALTTKRVYKDAIPHEAAVGIIAEGKGTHFDPEIVEVFLERASAFARVLEHGPSEPASEVLNFADKEPGRSS